MPKYIKEILTEKFKKESGFDQSAIEENLLEKLNFVSCRSCLNANNGNFMGFQLISNRTNLYYNSSYL